MPSFEHTNSQPKARKDDHFRPGEEVDAQASEEQKSIGLGQERLSWGDLAKEPEPEPAPAPVQPKQVIAEPAPEAAPSAPVSEEAATEEAATEEKPRPQRIDDSHLPNPGPALLQNRQNLGKSAGATRKRNRPETTGSKNLNAGHPMLVESPTAAEEKLSGRFAEGRPERQPRKPREDRPAVAESSDGAGRERIPPPREQPVAGAEDEPKPKRKRRRNRKKKPADGEAREENRSGEGHQGSPREGRESREGVAREGRPSARAPQRERQPRAEQQPRPVAKQPEPEAKGVMGAVKKFFGAIFGGGEPVKPQAKAEPEKREERPARDGQRGGQYRSGNRGGQHRGNRSGQGRGENRSGENRGPQGEGDDRPRRRGKRGGKNRHGGNRQGGGPRQGDRQAASDS